MQWDDRHILASSILSWAQPFPPLFVEMTVDSAVLVPASALSVPLGRGQVGVAVHALHLSLEMLLVSKGENNNLALKVPFCCAGYTSCPRG